MDPVTIGSILTIAGLVARWGYTEYQWLKSEERKRKQAAAAAKKKARAIQKAAFEKARKDAGLTDEGGGSRAGHEARAEWDREQAKRK